MWRCRICKDAGLTGEIVNGKWVDLNPERDNTDMAQHLEVAHSLNPVTDFVNNTALQRGGAQGKNRGPRRAAPAGFEQIENREWAP